MAETIFGLDPIWKRYGVKHHHITSPLPPPGYRRCRFTSRSFLRSSASTPLPNTNHINLSQGAEGEVGVGKEGMGWRKMENGCEENRVLPMGPPSHGFCHSQYTQKRSPPLHPNLRVFSPFYEFEHTKAGKYNIGKGGAWIIFSERRNFARLCLHKI